jgi:hypothetical protein
MSKAKTSTFIIDHTRCNPGAWTPTDVLALRDFVATGNLQYAAKLSKLGMVLVTSEDHEPAGGTLEHIGYAVEAEPLATYDDISEAVDFAGDDEITALYPIYRGHIRYAVAIRMGDEDGNYDGTEYELKPTLEEAKAYHASAYSDEPVPATPNE